MCREDLQNFKNWTYKWTEKPNELLPQGKAEIRGIADRLKNKVGSYFDTFKGKFTVTLVQILYMIILW